MSILDRDAFSKETTETLSGIGKGSGEAAEVIGLIFEDMLGKVGRLVRSVLSPRQRKQDMGK